MRNAVCDSLIPGYLVNMLIVQSDNKSLKRQQSDNQRQCGKNPCDRDTRQVTNISVQLEMRTGGQNHKGGNGHCQKENKQ